MKRVTVESSLQLPLALEQHLPLDEVSGSDFVNAQSLAPPKDKFATLMQATVHVTRKPPIRVRPANSASAATHGALKVGIRGRSQKL